MVANPVSGKVYVSNTEARNEVRFEGPGTFGGSTVRGHLHEARITVLDGANVLPRHLNPHIDYDVVPSPAGIKDASLATPLGMAVTSDGATLYVAAFGSRKVGIFDTTALENDTLHAERRRSHRGHAAAGRAGSCSTRRADRLYVLTRFDNAISVDRHRHRDRDRAPPAAQPGAAGGRRTAATSSTTPQLTSSNGEAACASCHIFGDFDSLAWDLGNPRRRRR